MDHNGDDVAIYKLSKPTPVEAFNDPAEIATCLPGGRVPEELHGVPFTPWDDAPRSDGEWMDVEGQAVIAEPEFERTAGKKVGAGVIVREPDGRIWVIHPTNGFGGYTGSFPKGTVEDGIGLQASAIKEAYEESGLKVEITGFLMDVERTTSKARYYLAKRVGGTPVDCGWESQAVSLVPVEKLYTALNMKPDHVLAEKLGAGPMPQPKWKAKPSGATSDPTRQKLFD
jgi:ADP-ribose pyrophosphatase YjhB (NUDIX family)